MQLLRPQEYLSKLLFDQTAQSDLDVEHFDQGREYSTETNFPN